MTHTLLLLILYLVMLAALGCYCRSMFRRRRQLMWRIDPMGLCLIYIAMIAAIIKLVGLIYASIVSLITQGTM
jgi:hypothetical protein